jgi:hypothetical protein
LWQPTAVGSVRLSRRSWSTERLLQFGQMKYGTAVI